MTILCVNVSKRGVNMNEALVRMRRWLMKERRMYLRIYRTSDSTMSKERAYGEMNVCNNAIRWIDKELKASSTKPSR